MRIQHNIMAMNAYRNMGKNNSAVSKNLEKLSSGYRINRAGDDAAGLAISEKMRAQIAGLDQAQKNAQSGINLVQTAEGALTEVHDMLNRMVTLTTQAANGTYGESDRAKIQAELDALSDEIDRIADNSNFNGTKLLDGSLSSTGAEAAGGKGDYLMIDAGSNKTTLTKNQQINAATQGKQTLSAAFDVGAGKQLTANTANENGFTFEVRYLDESGAEQTKTLKAEAGNAWTAATLNSTIATEITNAKIGLTCAADGTSNIITATSDTKGSMGAQLLGITITSQGIDDEGQNGVKIEDPAEIALDDTKTVKGRDADRSNQLKFADSFKIGDTITLGDKTYEIADPSGVNNVKEGNVAIAAGLDTDGVIDQGTTMANLVNGLIANGVDARLDKTNPTTTILIDDLSQISINRDSIDVDVKSDAITAGNANATKGAWEITAGVCTTSTDTNLTVKYLDAEGKEQTRTIIYQAGDAAAKDSAAAVKKAIEEDSVLKNLFKVEMIETTNNTVDNTNGTVVRLTALESGANAPKLMSVVSNDQTGMALSADLKQISEGMDASAGFTIGDDVRSGDTVSVAGKTFQFVKADEVAKVSDGNIAVVIETSGKKTAANFNEALKAAGFTTAYNKDSNGVRVVENEFSLGTNNKLEGAGMTLQIGSEAVETIEVSVDSMKAKDLGIQNLKIGKPEEANKAMEAVKAAIEKVSVERGKLGAVQNRLEHTINNLGVMEENIQDAEANIRDTDIADEMMAYTKNNILIQSAQAMLAQANQAPQGVLQLMG